MLVLLRTVIVTFAFAAVALAPAPVSALSGGDDAAASDNPDYAAGRKAIDAKQWTKAIEMMAKVVKEEAKNADAVTYLGYAYRKSGDFERAFANYKQALALNPKNKGAHEYIGEAYLQTGDLKQAEYHLDRLDSICFFGCPEYRELKKAVADYRAKHSG